ncbi:DNA/RNA non-specific endonuclease [Roseivirga sp. BDSF3-8]|uniref:DNA/RNA non-specific endonuclease n=1 Tax=Roseivirga sp. BDSF3-8 TaxID=3241598 RepID=UPI003531E974
MKKSYLLCLLATVFLAVSCSREEIRPGTDTESANEIPFHDRYTPEEEAFLGEDPSFKYEGMQNMATVYKDNNLAMGNPSGASSNSYYHWNYRVTKPEYTMSYHRDRGTPNWVSWHLNKAWLGSASRSSGFYQDYALPSGWYRVSSGDYTNSGFDRGHNCPSADRTLSSSENQSTFYMTNVIPQSPDVNQRAWASLENYCRDLVRYQNKELYVIMGSYGTGGSGRNGYKSKIANNKVTVPNRVWKVILVLPEGSSDLSRVTTSTRVIAVDMPNSMNVSTNWASYRTTVDYIEQVRGYNLFSQLPSYVQSAIESKVDNGPTS